MLDASLVFQDLTGHQLSLRSMSYKQCMVGMPVNPHLSNIAFAKTVGLLGGAVIAMIITLASVQRRLQQAATELGENLTMNRVLTLEELDGPASTLLDHAIRLAASSFNSLFEQRRKKQY